MKNLTNQFTLSKTLRFELIPQGETLQHINNKGLLEEDEQRAVKYQKVKKLIDSYHREFIDQALSSLRLDHIDRFEELYFKREKDEQEKKELLNLQKEMRKSVANCFAKNPDKSLTERFQNIFKKELIKVDLPKFLEDKEDKDDVAEFNNFSTYFTGFHENRKNMYSEDEKATAISYRIVHDNLPKFLSNKKNFEKIKQHHQDLYNQVKAELEKELMGIELDSFFENENFRISVKQNDITLYNYMIGGKKDGDVKVKGFNEYINLYRQKNGLKKSDIPNLAILYKQILGEQESMSWLPDEFENDQSLLSSIQEFYDSELRNFENGTEKADVFTEIEKLLQALSNYDQNRIFLRNDLSLTQISQNIFKDWSVIGTSLERAYEQEYPEWEKTKKGIEEKAKYLKKDFYSFEEIQSALQYYLPLNEELKSFAGKNNLFEYFRSFSVEKEDSKVNLLTGLEKRYDELKYLFATEYSVDDNLGQNEKDVEKIKNFLDALLALQQFIKPLNAKKLETEKDDAFYNDFFVWFDQLSKIIPLYDKVRNYLTKRPYSTKKYKLNFENSTLLDGWDLNKERDNTSVLLRKNGNYFLGIMNKKHNRIFEDYPKDENGANYEKIIYKLLPGANKMLPKVFLSKKGIENFQPSQEILDNYKRETHKKGEVFVKKDCHRLIDFFKESIEKHEDWSKFGFEFSDTASYEDLSGFYREVENQGYKISFDDISEAYINELVKEGKLYLFQIYNKDFSDFSKGKPNMHTLYWKMLFDEENLKNVVYKLNGQAEVFYRKKSITKNIITHKANEKIPNKNPLNPKKQSQFEYDIVKDRRFTVDKFQFHVPITMNFQARGNGNVNMTVNEYIKNTDDEIKVIGIDRGERHLLYFTLINQKGEIEKQFSLNRVENERMDTDFHALLQRKEDDRKEARKSWKTIENIKELKEGYLSLVVHEVSKLIIEQNAIVVLEDLNFGFKRGRFKVEKQVYQKFEKMLIDKLNYLVFKDYNPNEAGGLLNAYQLTSKFTSFKDLGKQSGILYYVPAWNTSKIDPDTGFVNLFYTKYENIEKSKAFFSNFKEIKFEENENMFSFTFDYRDFTKRAENTRTQWTVYTHGERIRTFRNPKTNNQWDNESIILTDEFQKLFTAYEIDFTQELQQQILQQTQSEFYKKLLDLFRLTVQMRNSITNSQVDYLISPVKNSSGKFFCSDDAVLGKPADADANGAYHIAKKGLWVIDQIKKTQDLKKIKLAISNEDWLNFVQK